MQHGTWMTVSLVVVGIVSLVAVVLLSVFLALMSTCVQSDCTDDAFYTVRPLPNLIKRYAEDNPTNPCKPWRTMRSSQREAYEKRYGASSVELITKSVPHSQSAKLGIMQSTKTPRGICVYVHGGGWCIGEYDIQNSALLDIAESLQCTVVSVKYRLAGDPDDGDASQVTDAKTVPPANEDCRQAVQYVVEHPEAIDGRLETRNGSPVSMWITGESAGAHLALDSLEFVSRLVDGPCPFRGASFLFGAFVPFSDRAPSCKGPTKDAPRSGWVSQSEDYVFLTKDMMARFQDAYCTRFDNPAVNLSLRSFTGLCPAQFIVGTQDMMLRGTIATYSQWRIAGNPGQLLVYEGMPHAFTLLPLRASAHARNARTEFLSSSPVSGKRLVEDMEGSKWDGEDPPPPGLFP